MQNTYKTLGNYLTTPGWKATPNLDLPEYIVDSKQQSYSLPFFFPSKCRRAGFDKWQFLRHRIYLVRGHIFGRSPGSFKNNPRTWFMTFQKRSYCSYTCKSTGWYDMMCWQSLFIVLTAVGYVEDMLALDLFFNPVLECSLNMCSGIANAPSLDWVCLFVGGPSADCDKHTFSYTQVPGLDWQAVLYTLPWDDTITRSLPV